MYEERFEDAATLSLATALGDLDAMVSGHIDWPRGRQRLLQTCQKLFDAEVVALFVAEGDEVVLDGHVGYRKANGEAIDLDDLRAKLRYRVGATNGEYDGLTGEVASRGVEIRCNSTEEIQALASHAGKTDELGIWNVSRPCRSVFAVPILRDKTLLGVLKVENHRRSEELPPSFEAFDRACLEAIAAVLAIALEHPLAPRPRAGLTSSELAGAAAEEELKRNVETYDRMHMARAIEGTPGQIRYALDNMAAIDFGGASFNRVVLAGMGGSALPGNVLKDAFSRDLRVRFDMHRHYGLPEHVDEHTLVIVSSYSGNTEETVSAFEALPEGHKGVIAVTAGGRLEELAKSRAGCALVRIPREREPEGFQPRNATGYFVTYIALALANAGVLPDVRPELGELADFLTRIDVRGDAERVARWIGPGEYVIPVVYSDQRHLESIAQITKIKINENAKRLAFFGGIPEINHNEMIGFTRVNGKYALLYIRDPESRPEVDHRFEVMRNLFRDERLRHVKFDAWTTPGETPLQRIFAALTFGDWLAYTLAILERGDPTPVVLVERFKQKLQELPS